VSIGVCVRVCVCAVRLHCPYNFGSVLIKVELGSDVLKTFISRRGETSKKLNVTNLKPLRSKRSGYCADNVPPVAELFADSDNSLLKRMLSNENHTLHEMLPPINKHKYNLRKRPHNS
jgi:hypothetical protein